MISLRLFFLMRRMISWRRSFSLRRFFRCDGSFRCGRALSVAAFWAGAAHPRRQKHREMPPPGASAPAFAATVEPLSNRCGARPHAEHPRQDASSTRDERVLGDVLRMRAEDRLIRASILDFRAKLENRCKVFPVYTIFRASILDFRAKLENQCKVLPVYALLRASILDFRARLGNRCKVSPVYTLLRASILDFRAKLENRCRVLPVYALLRASILDFKPRLGNRCRGEWFRLLQPSLPPQRFASDSNLRSGKEEWFRLQRSWWQRSSASDSNFRSVKEERFRLQRAWRTQAGTGCHEGGIILSKKPPEWHLFLPQQRSASDSNFLCGNREWFRLQRLLRQQRMVSPAAVVAATENGFAGYRYEVNRVRQCFRLPHRVWL